MRVLLLALLMSCAAPLWAAQPRTLTWVEMIPPNAPPQVAQQMPLHDLSQLADALAAEGGPAAAQQSPAAPVVQELDGQQVKLPITGRLVPVIADDYVDKEFGTGVVKVTPAHDTNDYQVGLRHNLPMITIFTLEAKVVDDLADIPAELRGLDRFVARKKIVAQIGRASCRERVSSPV